MADPHRLFRIGRHRRRHVRAARCHPDGRHDARCRWSNHVPYHANLAGDPRHPRFFCLRPRCRASISAASPAWEWPLFSSNPSTRSRSRSRSATSWSGRTPSHNTLLRDGHQLCPCLKPRSRPQELGQSQARIAGLLASLWTRKASRDQDASLGPRPCRALCHTG